MNQLADIRTIISYIKEGDEYEKIIELIFLIVKPTYEINKEPEKKEVNHGLKRPNR